MRNYTALTAAALIVASAGAADAKRGDDDHRLSDSGGRYCSVSPDAVKLSADQASAKASLLGYSDIRKVEWDDGCWEVYAFDKSGQRVEVYLHPVSGDVVKVERD